jgi:hypothetical protein
MEEIIMAVLPVSIPGQLHRFLVLPNHVEFVVRLLLRRLQWLQWRRGMN